MLATVIILLDVLPSAFLGFNYFEEGKKGLRLQEVCFPYTSI